MRSIGSKQSGFTMVEVLLVLVISMSLLYLSLKQYQVWRRDSEIRQVQYNVDLLFSALAQYYQAHCADSNNPLSQNQNIPGGTLNYAVSLSTLESQGFLSQTLLINSLASSFMVQFNQATFPRYVKMSNGESNSMGTILLWNAQVSAQLNPSYPASALQNALLADCLSEKATQGGANYVAPCGEAPSDASGYAVWERTPALPSQQGNANTWISQTRIPLFTQMYTTSPILNSTDPNESIGTNQYFRCVNQ